MKKLIAMIVTVICSVPIMLAQESVTGIVVDKKGNPLPGVRIEVPGTSDYAVSNLDGTFTLNRSDMTKKKLYAYYAGMNTRKMKIKEGMRIKMSESNWWTTKPDEWNWFAEAIFAVPQLGSRRFAPFNPAYGLMLGRVKKFGYYVKGVTNTFGMKNVTDDDLTFYDKAKSTYWSVTAGGIMRLGCPIHIYVGVGYSNYFQYARRLQGNWYKLYHSSDLGVDLGILLRIKRVTVSLGTCCGTGLSNDPGGFAGNFGVGYTF